MGQHRIPPVDEIFDFTQFEPEISLAIQVDILAYHQEQMNSQVAGCVREIIRLRQELDSFRSKAKLYAFRATLSACALTVFAVYFWLGAKSAWYAKLLSEMLIHRTL